MRGLFLCFCDYYHGRTDLFGAVDDCTSFNFNSTREAVGVPAGEERSASVTGIKENLFVLIFVLHL